LQDQKSGRLAQQAALFHHDGRTGPNPISQGARRLACPAGTVLLPPDDTSSGFVVLQEGSIRVSLTSAGGREIVLCRVRPGEICLQTFTWLAERRTYSVEGVA
jgi:CRP-like cAMP-binding protein